MRVTHQVAQHAIADRALERLREARREKVLVRRQAAVEQHVLPAEGGNVVDDGRLE